MKDDAIGEIELAAYVDDQLDAARRLEVEAYLANHPEHAARVMADLRTRDALRLLARTSFAAPPGIAQAAARLDRALARRRLVRTASPLVVAGALVAIGWLGADVNGIGLHQRQAAPAPRFVQEAAMAHRVALVRAAMLSQPEVTTIDPAEVRAATNIVLPELPTDWRVLDAQIFPSDDGPSLQVTVDRGDGEPVSLFAVRARTGAPVQPATTRAGDEVVAYWQEGDVALALTGDEPEAELDRVAQGLADNTIG